MRIPFKSPRSHPQSQVPAKPAAAEEPEESYSMIVDGQTTATMASQNARVYLYYDMENPPAHPGDKWTRFICMSDTHSDIFPVPDGDVLLHSGDLSSWGYLSQLEKTMNWLKTLPHPVKM